MSLQFCFCLVVCESKISFLCVCLIYENKIFWRTFLFTNDFGFFSLQMGMKFAPSCNSEGVIPDSLTLREIVCIML